MAGIQGTNIVAPVVPLDTADVHPTHVALYGKGGYRTVATTAERDAIPSARREAGMLVFVTADSQRYRLGSDLTTWTVDAAGASAWADITGKPSTFSPSSHAASHAAAGSDPITVGTTADRIVVTTTSGKLATANRLLTTQVQHDSGIQLSSIDSLIADAGSYGLDAAVTLHTTKGTTSDTVCAGNDSRLSDSRTPTGSAGGSLAGTYPSPTLAATAVTAASYGSASSVATFTVGADGRLTAAGTTAISVAASAIASGTIATARLGSGTASASTFLRGDQTYAAPPVTSVDGGTGAVTITKTEIYDFTPTSKPVSASGSNGSYSWTVPTGAKFIKIFCVGSGGGGASGRRGATSTSRGGGAGGYGGSAFANEWAISDLPSTALTISAPAGGSGAAAVTADNTNGNAGTQGGDASVVCSGFTLLQTWQANPGNGGTTSGGTISSAYYGGKGEAYFGSVATAGAGSATGDGSAPSGSANIGTRGGGGGGAATSSNTSGAGGRSFIPMGLYTYDFFLIAGQDSVSGGTAGGGAGANGKARAVLHGIVGGGGSGGGGNANGVGGNGGDGAFPGGGGGGGGASLNGNNSGAGGNGGGALVRITVYY